MNDDKKRDKNKMRMLLRSLARNESTIASKETLTNDIEEYESNKDLIESRITVSDYLDVLERFKALVERDLQIYIENLDGKLYHFRDNVTGLEIDAIFEFSGGNYAAVEINLGYNKIEEAKKELLKFYDNMLFKPKFMCIITSNFSSVVKDKENSIYILPITYNGFKTID